jgi:hypothetical protein
MQAYRASDPATEPRMLAAEALSSVMRSMGDYAQALELNEEVIDWERAKEATLSLSVSRFLRASILRDLKNPRAAITELTEGRGSAQTASSSATSR